LEDVNWKKKILCKWGNPTRTEKEFINGEEKKGSARKGIHPYLRHKRQIENFSHITRGSHSPPQGGTKRPKKGKLILGTKKRDPTHNSNDPTWAQTYNFLRAEGKTQKGTRIPGKFVTGPDKAPAAE